ncbi:E3 ubiquitin-protein ligase RNF31-like [Pelodytes ibericus]
MLAARANMETIHEGNSSEDNEPTFDNPLRQCPICCDDFLISKLVTMTHCCCSLCKGCFIAHFTAVIKEKNITSVTCPICLKPDVENGENLEEILAFLSLLDTQMRHNLDKATYELFQSKLLDSELMKQNSFRWCSHCPNGFYQETDDICMNCPDCKKSTCFNCKIPWEKEHEGMSCEQFQIWKQDYEREKLDAYLIKYGIDCPQCGQKYELDKGGCLHFTCTRCQYQFCGWCKRSFKQGSNCKLTSDCKVMGLHAHHSRSCFYYLRDWDTKRLHQILEEGFNYLFKLLSSEHNRGAVGVDELRQDQKEYLVKLINDHSLDPVELFTKEEMETELERWHIEFIKNIGKDNDAYLQRLKEVEDLQTFLLHPGGA